VPGVRAGAARRGRATEGDGGRPGGAERGADRAVAKTEGGEPTGGHEAGPRRGVEVGRGGGLRRASALRRVLARRRLGSTRRGAPGARPGYMPRPTNSPRQNPAANTWTGGARAAAIKIPTMTSRTRAHEKLAIDSLPTARSSPWSPARRRSATPRSTPPVDCW